MDRGSEKSAIELRQRTEFKASIIDLTGLGGSEIRHAGLPTPTLASARAVVVFSPCPTSRDLHPSIHPSRRRGSFPRFRSCPRSALFRGLATGSPRQFLEAVGTQYGKQLRLDLVIQPFETFVSGFPPGLLAE